MTLVKYPIGIRDIELTAVPTEPRPPTQTGPGWSYEVPNGDLLTIPNVSASNEVRFNFYYYPGREVTPETHPGIYAIGADVTVESISGGDRANLYWNWAFDGDVGYVAFQPNGDSTSSIPLTAPGVYTNTPTGPYYIGGTYGGLYDVAARIANTTGYYHGYGELSSGLLSTGYDIVISHFYPYFLAEVADSMVRQWPNDSGGLTTTPRLFPPPRRGRTYGGHH